MWAPAGSAVVGLGCPSAGEGLSEGPVGLNVCPRHSGTRTQHLAPGRGRGLGIDGVAMWTFPYREHRTSDPLPYLPITGGRVVARFLPARCPGVWSMGLSTYSWPSQRQGGGCVPALSEGRGLGHPEASAVMTVPSGKLESCVCSLGRSQTPEASFSQ